MNNEEEIKKEKNDEEEEEGEAMCQDETNEDPMECNFCNQVFPNQSDLQSHKNSVHFQLEVFQCQKCVARFMSELELKAHLPMHVRKRPRPKPNDSMTDGEDNMKRGKSQFQALMIDEDLEKGPPAAVHSQRKVFQPLILSGSSYTCGECQETFPSSAELMLHFDLHPEPQTGFESSESQNSEVSCGFCDEVFPSKKWVKIHSKYHHSRINMSKLSLAQQFIRSGVNCSACSSSFLRLDEYYNHLLETHGSLELHKMS